MSELTLPAPLWRRFAAAVYDSLLLIGLSMATLVLSLPFDALFHPDARSPVFRILLFLVGFVFFGWFWTRGGQTLGMRAWSLAVRREDGTALRLPIAAIRYVATLICWGGALLPVAAAFIARSARLMAEHPHAVDLGVAASIAIVLVIVLRGLDTRSRLPQDWISGTEVVQLPKAPR